MLAIENIMEGLYLDAFLGVEIDVCNLINYSWDRKSVVAVM